MTRQIVANGKTYSYSTHAMERIEQREIHEEWIIECIESPDFMSVDRGGNDLYHRVITTHEGMVHPLIVVIKEESGTIITVMEDTQYQ